MADKVHIALVANDRYRPGLECTKTSMIRACATPERLVFHEFGDKNMAPFLDRVELRDFNGSKLPYLRLFLPELLPECDWVIYSDVDTLWFKDPCGLWNERDDSVSICWVKDLDVCSMDFNRWIKSLQPPTTIHQPPSTNHQSPTTNHQSPTTPVRASRSSTSRNGVKRTSRIVRLSF